MCGVLEYVKCQMPSTNFQVSGFSVQVSDSTLRVFSPDPPPAEHPEPDTSLNVICNLKFLVTSTLRDFRR